MPVSLSLSNPQHRPGQTFEAPGSIAYQLAALSSGDVIGCQQLLTAGDGAASVAPEQVFLAVGRAARLRQCTSGLQ